MRNTPWEVSRRRDGYSVVDRKGGQVAYLIDAKVATFIALSPDLLGAAESLLYWADDLEESEVREAREAWTRVRNLIAQMKGEA